MMDINDTFPCTIQPHASATSTADAPAVPSQLVTTWLEIADPQAWTGSFGQHPLPHADVRIELMTPIDVTAYRALYRAVGEKLRWRDRLIMPETELAALLTRPDTCVYVLSVNGATAGYIELNRVGDSTEIAYFGLLDVWQGVGLGRHLLSFGIQTAFAQGARRIWLHTCNLDGPHALANYQKRGFRITHQQHEPMPARYL